MTDKEFIEMTRLFESLTKGADTLRVVFQKDEVEDKEKAIRTGGEITTRPITTDKAKLHDLFDARWALLDKAQREVEELDGLINGCEDWTSDKFKASEIYRMMREFVSATADMPKGISYPFKSIHSLCGKPMGIIPGKYPDLYPPIIRELMADSYYQIAVNRGDITPPFTWNRSIKELAIWLDETTLLSVAKIDQVEGKEDRRNWMLVDNVFCINGKPITAKQLRSAIKG